MPTPPLVASRITWISFVTSNIAFTFAQRGAQSLVTSASMPNSSRAKSMVQPCLPISPDTITASPALASLPEVLALSIILPMPVVVMKTPST